MTYFYSFRSSQFGHFTIVWRNRKTSRILRIFLSTPEISSQLKMKKKFPFIEKRLNPQISKIAGKIKQFMSGKIIHFDLREINLSQCSEFQRKVILMEAKIPRGKISTYKRLANKIGSPNGARAVGNALANNPFPILIPCHRVVKSNLEVGQYQGGFQMKRKLLQMEGILFETKNKVSGKFLWY